VGVGRQSSKCLDFSQIVYLLKIAEQIFHALDCYVFACFYALGLEDFAESAFSFFGY